MGGSRRSCPGDPATVPPGSRHPRLPPKRGRRHGGDGRRARSLRPAPGSDHRRAGDGRRDVNCERTATVWACAGLGSCERVPLDPEIPAPEVTTAEVAAAEISPEVTTAVVPVTGIAVTGIAVTRGRVAGKDERGCQRLAEQEPGGQARTEAEAAPVCRREAGVDVTDRRAVDLHVAHLGLDALVDLVRAGGARRNGTAGPTIGRPPVDIAHRHAVPRVKKA